VLIHPSHVEVVNRVYTPSPDRVAYYEGMLAAFEDAVAEGRGAVVYEGEHIDAAHASTARQVVEFAQRLAQMGGE
jgi:citrate lyase subunit beta/citryl-CoA lyase